MRSILLLSFALLVMVFESSVLAPTALKPLLTYPFIPMVLYLGMAPDVSMIRGASNSFALGVMMDSFSGHSLGAWTLVCMLLFVVARGAGWRVFMRGRSWQVVLSITAAAAAGVSMIAIRGVFRPAPPFVPFDLLSSLRAVCIPALATGAISPFILRLVRRIELFRRREESTVSA